MVSNDAIAPKLVSQLSIVGPGVEPRALELDANDEVPLAGVAAGECVELTVSVARAAAEARGPNAPRITERAIMLAPDYWLWVPKGGSAASLRFELPRGFQAAVPWPRKGETYEVPDGAERWKALAAFGQLDARTLHTPSLELEVVTVGASKRTWDPWLKQSAEAVSTLYPGLEPVPALVVLLPRPQRSSSFGWAFRGGGRSTLLQASPNPQQLQLKQGWAAVHELLHLRAPYVRLEDAWFFEGITTYYTAVLRAREGALSPEEGWWELVDGFARGQRSGTGQSLQSESDSMRQTFAFWRVYWSGAAIALEWDVRLRRAGSSLDAFMRQLALRDARVVELAFAEELIRDAQRGLPVDLWSVCSPHLPRQSFPETRALLRRLGVEAQPDGSVKLVAGPETHIRDAIMATP